MQYINKSENAVKGYQIVDTLKEDAWNHEEQKYIDFNYNGLGKAQYRDEIIQLTLQEQKDYCCYCMKIIPPAETSLEHIIPQIVSKDDFHKYLIVNELTNNVFHKDELNPKNKLEKLEKYPHDIAYHNLVASCRNKFHCNSKRGNLYIEPIMYYEKINEMVWYEKNGSISSENLDVFLKDYLGLNQPYLESIRKLWRLLSKKFETIPDPMDLTGLLEDMIDEAIATDDDVVIFIERFTGNNNLSKVFRHYEWFFYYYKNKYL